MARKFLDYDHSLVDSGKWIQLVKSLRAGAYEISLPDYSSLRSLQVTVSKVNTDAGYPLKMTTTSNYSALLMRIDVSEK